MRDEHQTQLVTSTVDPGSEQEVNAEEITRMLTQAFVWRCSRTRCEDRVWFTGNQIEAVPFLIVRHLLRAHGLRTEQIVAAEPLLRDAVSDYCRRMGLRR